MSEMITRRTMIVGLASLPILSKTVLAADSIKVGVIIPLSGGAGRQGQDVTNCIQAMASLINADGGVMGRPDELLVRDDESTAAIGIAKANELISAGVAVVIEGWNSPVTLAMQSVLARANVLDITMISKADSILTSAANPLAIRLNSANSQDATIIAKYLGGKMKSGRIVFVTENDAYGNGAQKGIEEQFKKANLDYTIATTLKFPFPQTDFRIEITSIRDVSWSIDAGRILGIIGPNGAGKSTCFMAATNMTPHAGRLILKGADVTHVRAHRLPRLGLRRTFQQNAFFGGMTVLRNMVGALLDRTPSSLAGSFFVPWIESRRRREIEAEAAQHLSRFEIEESLHHRLPGELSYGAQRMLSIAIA